MMDRPSDGAIAQAYFEELHYSEKFGDWLPFTRRPAMCRIYSRAREIDFYAASVADDPCKWKQLDHPYKGEPPKEWFDSMNAGSGVG